MEPAGSSNSGVDFTDVELVDIPLPDNLSRMRQMMRIYTKLKDNWQFSGSYFEQRRFIREKILTIDSLQIGGALCIGINRLSNRNPKQYKDSKLNKKARGSKWALDWRYDRKGLKGLCQLVLFQCWLEILREKFPIEDDRILFYFPYRMNLIEKLFMQGLGYGANMVFYYHELKDFVTPETFLFGTTKHTKHWHESLLKQVLPTLAVFAPLQVNGYWKNYSRRTEREFRRFLNTVHSRKLGPFVDVIWAPPKEIHRLRKEPDTREGTELLMSDILMNYEFYFRPDPDLTKEREKPMYGWYTPMAWNKLPGPTGLSRSINDMNDMAKKWRLANMSWWQWFILRLPWLIYFDIIVRWIKSIFIDTFWPDYVPLAGGHRWPVVAVWDSREEGGKVWYLVETRTRRGTDWGHWWSEDLGEGARGPVNDFHYASPGRRKGHVPISLWDMLKELVLGDPYADDTYDVHTDEEEGS